MVMMSAAPVLTTMSLLSKKCLVNLLLFLLNEERLHWIIVIMFVDQQCQLPFLLEHRSLRFIRVLVTFTGRVIWRIASSPLLLCQHIRPANLALLRIVIVTRLVPRVVNAQHAARDGGAAEIVDR